MRLQQSIGRWLNPLWILRPRNHQTLQCASSQGRRPSQSFPSRKWISSFWLLLLHCTLFFLLLYTPFCPSELILNCKTCDYRLLLQARLSTAFSAVIRLRWSFKNEIKHRWEMILWESSKASEIYAITRTLFTNHKVIHCDVYGPENKDIFIEISMKFHLIWPQRVVWPRTFDLLFWSHLLLFYWTEPYSQGSYSRHSQQRGSTLHWPLLSLCWSIQVLEISSLRIPASSSPRYSLQLEFQLETFFSFFLRSNLLLCSFSLLLFVRSFWILWIRSDVFTCCLLSSTFFSSPFESSFFFGLTAIAVTSLIGAAGLVFVFFLLLSIIFFFGFFDFMNSRSGVTMYPGPVASHEVRYVYHPTPSALPTSCPTALPQRSMVWLVRECFARIGGNQDLSLSLFEIEPFEIVLSRGFGFSFFVLPDTFWKGANSTLILCSRPS